MIPLIDELAAAQLREIEAEAGMLLKRLPRLDRDDGGVDNRALYPAATVRDAMQLLDRCSWGALPPPPALMELLGVLLKERPSRRAAVDRRAKRHRAIEYLATHWYDEKQTVNGLATAAGVHWATARKWIAQMRDQNSSLHREVSAERDYLERRAEIDREIADAGDFMGLRSRDERRAEVRRALGLSSLLS